MSSDHQGKNPIHRSVFWISVVSLLIFLNRCANDAQFNSSPKVRVEEKSEGDAVPEPPKKIEDQGVPPAASINVSDPSEVSAPTSFGANFDISTSAEVPPTKIPKVDIIKVDFPVSKMLSGQLLVNAQEKSLMTSVTLADAFSSEKDVYTQTERPIVTEIKAQGNPGIAKNQTFNQNSFGLVDIQVVVDNSGSMKQEQEKIATKLQDLLQYIGNSHWQINVTSTDPANPCSSNVGIIKKGEADASARFAQAIKLGVEGSGTEQGIRRAVEGLSCASAANWVRPNSKVVVLIASDEDNCSNGSGCSQPYASETYLLNYLANTLGRPLGTGAKIYGIVGIPTPAGSSQKACSDVYNLGNIYLKAIQATNGYAGEICDPDYTNTFQAISKDIASLLETKYPLDAVPDPQSLKVFVNGIEISRLAANGSANWEIDPLTNKTLVFKGYIPQYGDSINVTYTVGAKSPLLKSFSLSQLPHIDGTSIFNVYVNGSLAQNGSNYQYDAKTNSVIFSVEPPVDSEVKIVYKKAMNLSTKFKLKKPVASGTKPVVRVNGVEQTQFVYDQVSGEVVFNTAPPEGSGVEIVYTSRIGTITQYPLVFIGNQIKNPTIYYEKNGQILNGAKIEGSTLIVPDGGLVAGDKVIIKYFNETSGALSVKLPQNPIQGSLSVTPSEGTCSATLSQATLELTLDCSALGAKTVAIKWSYQTEPERKFVMDKVQNPEVGSWVVLIDGVKTEAFSRVGQTVTLNTTPPASAIVTIEYTEMN